MNLAEDFSYSIYQATPLTGLQLSPCMEQLTELQNYLKPQFLQTPVNLQNPIVFIAGWSVDDGQDCLEKWQLNNFSVRQGFHFWSKFPDYFKIKTGFQSEKERMHSLLECIIFFFLYILYIYEIWTENFRVMTMKMQLLHT